MVDFVGFDTETTGLDYCLSDTMFGYSLGYPEEERLTVHRLDGPQSRQIRNQRMLEELWSDGLTHIPKSMHNAKFDLGFTEKHLGKRLDEHVIHDTLSAMYILKNNRQSHGLKEICWELAGIPMDDERAVKDYVKQDEANYSNVPEHLMDTYQETDALRQTIVTMFAIPLLKENPTFWKIYDEVERPLVWTTLRIEQRGVMVSDERAHELMLWLEEETEKARQDLISVGGSIFEHPTDTKYRWLLFSKLGLPILKRTEVTKEASTDKDTLLELRETHPHKAIEAIFRYRTYRLGVSKVQTYLDLCDADGVLHPHISPNGAKKTTRESSSNPNIQNVSKEKVLKNPYTVPARRIFVPKPGYINLHVDYSGIEMRLIVHYSQEPELVRILRRGGDIHLPAAKIFYSGGRKYESALRSNPVYAKTLRDAAKNGHFAICYTCGAPELASVLVLPIAEGKRVWDLYYGTFPRNANLWREIARIAQEQGYVDTLFGRRIYMNREQSYKGINTLIQATAAGLIKRAQNRVHNYLEDATSGEAGIIMPIHDELIIEYPRDRLTDLHEILEHIVALMIDFPEVNVPLEVDIVRSTRDWTTVKEVMV